MTGAQITEAWAGKEVMGTAANASRVFLRLEADGKASVQSGNLSDTGTWRSTDNGYCTTWARIRNGQETCFTVVRQGGRFLVINPDGSNGALITHVR